MTSIVIDIPAGVSPSKARMIRQIVEFLTAKPDGYLVGLKSGLEADAKPLDPPLRLVQPPGVNAG